MQSKIGASNFMGINWGLINLSNKQTNGFGS